MSSSNMQWHVMWCYFHWSITGSKACKPSINDWETAYIAQISVAIKLCLRTLVDIIEHKGIWTQTSLSDSNWSGFFCLFDQRWTYKLLLVYEKICSTISRYDQWSLEYNFYFYNIFCWNWYRRCLSICNNDINIWL